MNRVEEFGKAVKRARLERGMTQEQLAEKADLHVNSISFIERGMVPPALDTICALADALGGTVTELVAEMEKRYGV